MPASKFPSRSLRLVVGLVNLDLRPIRNGRCKPTSLPGCTSIPVHLNVDRHISLGWRRSNGETPWSFNRTSRGGHFGLLVKRNCLVSAVLAEGDVAFVVYFEATHSIKKRAVSRSATAYHAGRQLERNCIRKCLKFPRNALSVPPSTRFGSALHHFLNCGRGNLNSKVMVPDKTRLVLDLTFSASPLPTFHP